MKVIKPFFDLTVSSTYPCSGNSRHLRPTSAISGVADNGEVCRGVIVIDKPLSELGDGEHALISRAPPDRFHGLSSMQYLAYSSIK